MKRDGFLQRRDLGPRRINDRDRYLLRGQLLFQPSDDLVVPPDRRLFAAATKNAAARSIPAGAELTIRPGSATDAVDASPAIERCARRDHRGRSRSRARSSITPGPRLRAPTSTTGGVSGEVDLRPRRRRADLDHRLSRLTSTSRGQDTDYNNLDILYRADDGGFRNLPTFSQELRLQGTTVERSARLAGRRLLRQREARGRDNLTLRQPVCRSLFAAALVATSAARRWPHFPRAQAASTRSPRLSLGRPADRPTAPFAARPGARAHRYSSIGIDRAQHGLNTPVDNQRRNMFQQTAATRRSFTHNIFNITDQLSLTLGAPLHASKRRTSARTSPVPAQCAAYPAAFIVAVR